MTEQPIEVKKVLGSEYKVLNDTWFHPDTPDEVVRVMERLRQSKVRVTLDYGNPVTGESWGEINDITGYIGRSMGPVKAPILVYNRRSYGGGVILTKSILAIRYANQKHGGVIWKCANYKETSDAA